MKPYIEIGDKEIHIKKQFDPAFLELSEKDEVFPVSDVELIGKVYQVSDRIVISAAARTGFRMPCAMCNEMFVVNIFLPEWMHDEALRAIGEKWDISQPLREALLLQIPFYAQCGEKTCTRRHEIEPYLHTENRPFKALENFFE